MPFSDVREQTVHWHEMELTKICPGASNSMVVDKRSIFAALEHKR